ncbi:hypothetical protein IQ25_03820 [Novosphingobium taihuense]|nr:hypothetical protein IQ25_03820 [Novosphingobium taihuense]
MRGLVVLCVAVLLGLLPGRAFAQSFDCAKAQTVVDKAICADAAVAREDADMARLYAAAGTSAWGKGRSNQVAAQREWIADRNTCGHLDGKDATPLGGCLLLAYQQRNRDLAVALLFTDRALALQVLRRVDPEGAGLYEAIALYVDRGRGWDRAVTGLITPYWKRLQSGESASYGRDIVAYTMRGPQDVIRSDEDFGAFAYIVSAYFGGVGGTVGAPFPCGALVRRPGLLSAVMPRFGSTLDSFAFYTDCGSTQPPQPRFDAFLDSLTQVDPDCEEGTIRFAMYKSAALDPTSAGLGLPLPQGQFKGRPQSIKPTLVSAAIAELADQYWRYAGLNRAEADKRARGWIARLLRAKQTCGE